MKKIVIISLFILSILFFFYLIFFNSSNTFKNIKNLNKGKIVNTTDDKYIDTILYCGLNLSNIDSINIVILPIENKSKYLYFNDNIEFKALINYYSGVYYLYIDDNTRNENIEIISHEIVHINQYYNKKLILLNNGYVIWNGDTLNGNKINYYERPWEIEAFSEQNIIKNKILKILY